MPKETTKTFELPSGIYDYADKRVTEIVLSTDSRAESVYSILQRLNGYRGLHDNAGVILTDEVLDFVADGIKKQKVKKTSKASLFLDFARIILGADNRDLKSQSENYQTMVRFIHTYIDEIVDGLNQDLREANTILSGALVAELLGTLNSPPKQRSYSYSEPDLKGIFAKLEPVFEKFFDQGISPETPQSNVMSQQSFEKAKRDFLKICNVNDITLPEFFIPIREELVQGIVQAMFNLAARPVAENFKIVKALSQAFFHAGQKGVDSVSTFDRVEPVQFAKAGDIQLLAAWDGGEDRVFLLSLGEQFSVVRKTEEELIEIVAAANFSSKNVRGEVVASDVVKDLLEQVQFYQEITPHSP